MGRRVLRFCAYVLGKVFEIAEEQIGVYWTGEMVYRRSQLSMDYTSSSVKSIGDQCGC